MIDAILAFILKYKFIFIFYLVIIALLIYYRKKVQTQAKIIFMIKSKFGLKFMDLMVEKYRQWVILFGYISVGAGYIGLIFISYILLKNLYDLLFVADAASGVSLVLPGVNIPGLGILPFWYWLIAIFIIALVHEAGHGVVARAHNIPVKSTGIVLLGPIIGAFVEPDEKKMMKEKDIKIYSVLAAGPFTNIILAVLALVLLTFVFTPIQDAMVEPQGFSFAEYINESYPAAQAGLPLETPIIGLNDEETTTFQEFADILFCKAPGDEITVTSFNEDGEKEDYNLTLVENPDKEGKSFLGIISIKNEFEVKEKYEQGVWKAVYYSVDWMNGFLRWLFILSLGIGLFNLLPLPIVDGGRMVQVTMRKVKGEKLGDKRYKQISMFFLTILILNLILPLIMNALGL
ncbi:MAG: site-2 protease family protein [archaeon]